MIWQLFMVLVLIYCAVLRWRARHRIAFAKNFKNNIKSLPILGHAYLFAQCKSDSDRWKILKRFGEEALKQGGTLCSWNLHRLYFVVADPVIAECVMKTCLEKDDAMKITVGNGSAVADVPIWRPRRKVLVPTFSQKYLLQFAKIFSKQSMTMVKQLEKLPGGGLTCISKHLTTLTMDSVCETTLGVEAHAQENPNMKVLDAFTHSCRLISDRITKPWLHYEPIYKLTANHTEYAGHVDTIYSFIQEVITDKRNEMAAKNIGNNKIYDVEDEDRLMSFMELMIKSAGYTDTVLKEEIVVLFIAGTDTSALVTSFTTAMLARHPDIQEKVYKELQEVFDGSKRPVLYDDLPHLKYLEAVIKETMRLYPPAPILLRKVDEDVMLPSGLTLPKGTGIVIDVYSTHRNPAYWGKDVETFRPERFNTPVKHPAAFLAFSNGPRNCIGYRYAMMSMKTSLATLLRHYEVAPISEKLIGQPIDLKFDIMLRATDNFQLILKPRP